MMMYQMVSLFFIFSPKALIKTRLSF
jgi:hypothetical protein